MLFQNQEESLKIEAAAYEFPQGTGEDAQWLVLKGTYTDAEGNVTIDRNSCLTTEELQAMTAGLKVLAAGIRDVYESDFAEPYFELTVERVEDGVYQTGVAFTMLNAPEDWDTAEIELLATESDLKGWIVDLEATEKRFPVRE